MAAPEPPAPPGPGSPRWLVPLTVVVVVVLVAPIVVAAVHWLTSSNGSGDTARAKDPHPSVSASAPAPPKASRTPSASPSARPSHKPSASTSTSPSSSSSVPSSASTSRAAFTCWDGTPAQKLDACPEPSGLAGLQWVYPSMAHQQCVQQHHSDGAGRTLEYACLASLADGTKVLVKYSQWTSAQAASAHYDKPKLVFTQLVDAAGQPTVYGWLGPAKGQNVGINAFAAEPFSVEVYLDDPAKVILAITTVVQAQLYDQVRGAPTG